MVVGIDLALRNTGIVMLTDDGTLHEFYLLTSDPKIYNNEDLLIYNRDRLIPILDLQTLKKGSKIKVALEGLSFNSLSASIDLIDANHWLTRLIIKGNKCLDLTVLPVKSWQKSIITKDVLKEFTEKFPTVRAKKGKKLTKEETSANTKAKAQRRKETKQLILNAVPAEINKEFEKYILTNKLQKDTILDLADAYHIAKYILDVKNG